MTDRRDTPDQPAAPAERALPPDAQGTPSPAAERALSPAAERALAEAAERRAAAERAESARQAEIGGRNGPEPTRYGDWEKAGIVSDF